MLLFYPCPDNKSMLDVQASERMRKMKNVYETISPFGRSSQNHSIQQNVIKSFNPVKCHKMERQGIWSKQLPTNTNG